ncbi:hypothetical protein FB451DRAFT_461394, partial [Mycena latifolia]
PPPPRALSALSHTLRALEAVTSTASAAYGSAASVYGTAASAYAYGANTLSSGNVAGRRASMHAPPVAPHYASSPYSYPASGTPYALGRGGSVEGSQGGLGRGGRREGGQGEEDADGEDAILGARWDEVGVGGRTARLLTLTYAGGVQLWDASALGGVAEVLNLRVPPSAPSSALHTPSTPPSSADSPSATVTLTSTRATTADEKPSQQEGEEELGMHGPIVGAAVLPPAPREGREKEGKESLEMGVLTPHALYVYSLTRGRVVGVWAPPAPLSPPASHGRRDGEEQEKAIGTPCAFEAAERFIVVTTNSPPALVILARPSLRVLHVIPASALALPPPPPTALFSNTGSTPPYTNNVSSPQHTAPPPPPPEPIFALHGRLLAFLASPPTAPPPELDGARGSDNWGRTLGSSIGRFFSRSAPAATALASSAAGLFAGSPGEALASVSSALAGGGGGGTGWVRVVDLARGLRDVHAFQAGRAPVGGLAFARDGTRVVVVRRDGLGAGVWGIRPSPTSGGDAQVPAQLYELRRGRTGAVVEGVVGARDGRFVALATRRRTVHVFAVNPYGGRADVRSHLGARVRDGEGVAGGDDAPTEVHALVRMRLPAAPQGEDAVPPAALAVAFVPPAASTPAHPLRSPVSPPLPSPSTMGAQSGVQDVLVFDPADGVLSLRRVTVALEAAHGAGLPISVSLPAGRLAMGTSMSASPPAYAASYARGHRHAAGAGAGGPAAGEVAPGAELGGREAVVATWSLRRRRGWAEIRRAELGEAGAGEAHPVKQDWLAQAELSTFSSAPRVLPRPIYLSHQFSFHTLGEDYHALIRRYQFAIGGAKIEVRREVEVSAFAAGGAGGESFVEGYASSPRAIRRRSRASSSFDEPLASALAGTHYARPPPVLPMLPNGSPASFRSSMPVRAVAGLGDGVAEGLGRLRREMRHQRQKQLAARSPRARGGDDVEASVPLAFDEEDEDFALPPPSNADSEAFLRVHADREDDDALSATTSRNGDSVASVSTPATSAHPLDDEERLELDLGEGEGEGGEWHGWAVEDTLAVEEAERFDDISVVGFLDEEQAAMRAEAERRRGVAVAEARAGRRRKRRA